MPFSINYAGVSVATLYFRDCPSDDPPPNPLQQFCVKGQDIIQVKRYYKFREEWFTSVEDFEQAPWILDVSRTTTSSGTFSYDSASGVYVSSGNVMSHNCPDAVCSLDNEYVGFDFDNSSSVYQDYTMRKVVIYGYTMRVSCDTPLPPISFPSDPPLVLPPCDWESNFIVYLAAVAFWRSQLALVIIQNNVITGDFIIHNSQVPSARIIYGSSCEDPAYPSVYNPACVFYTLADLSTALSPLPPFPIFTPC